MDHYEETTLLGNYSDGYEIHTVEDILIENEILYIKKQKGGGELTQIMTGFNPYGIDVYVNKDDLERAKEIINGIFESIE